MHHCVFVSMNAYSVDNGHVAVPPLSAARDHNIISSKGCRDAKAGKER